MKIAIPGTNLVIESEAPNPGNAERGIEIYAVDVETGETEYHVGFFVTLHNSDGWKINLTNPAADASSAFDISSGTGKLFVDGIGLEQ